MKEIELLKFEGSY